MKKILGMAAVTVAATIAMAQNTATTAPAAPAQTTTATAPTAAPAATKPWSISLKMLADVDAGETRTANAAIDTENTISAKYKLNDKETIGAEHIFYMTKAGINTDEATRAAFARAPVQGSQLGVSYKRALDTSILGAKLAPAVKLTRFADSTAIDFSASKFAWQVQLDNNLSWTLTPLLSFDFYTQARAYIRGEDAGARGQSTAHRLLQSSSLTANVTDSFGIYQAVTTVHGFEDGWAMRESRQRLALETGLNYSPAALKGLALNLNVNTDMTYSARLSGFQRHEGGLWEDGDNNQVVYEAVVSYTY